MLLCSCTSKRRTLHVYFHARHARCQKYVRTSHRPTDHHPHHGWMISRLELSEVIGVPQGTPSLVGGWGKTPLKNMSSSVGMMTFPIVMGKYKMFQTTNQIELYVHCMFYINQGFNRCIIWAHVLKSENEQPNRLAQAFPTNGVCVCVSAQSQLPLHLFQGLLEVRPCKRSQGSADTTRTGVGIDVPFWGFVSHHQNKCLLDKQIPIVG